MPVNGARSHTKPSKRKDGTLAAQREQESCRTSSCDASSRIVTAVEADCFNAAETQQAAQSRRGQLRPRPAAGLPKLPRPSTPPKEGNHFVFRTDWDDSPRADMSPAPPCLEESSDGVLVVWSSDGEQQSRGGVGLGAIQPDGREQVLQQWCRPGAAPKGGQQAQQSQKTPKCTSVRQRRQQDSRAHQQLLRQNLSQMTDAPKASLCVNQAYIKGLSAEGPSLDWSNLSSKSKNALWHWVLGQVGGRHCLMILEHDVAIDFLISPLDNDEVVMSDLKGSAVLNALSGLQVEAQAQGGRMGSWLYDEVFAKSPPQVLEDAFKIALEDAAESWNERPGGLSVQQVNLSLKRQGMRAQAAGMQSMVQGRLSKDAGPRHRSSEEYLRVQIWLELLRLHVEGALGSPMPLVAGSIDTGDAWGSNAGAAPGSKQWDDRVVLNELQKQEAERTAESQRMSLDALRMQNRNIEAYLMRLVRQRDELKHIARLAEECDSYIILGLDGPDATEDEVKKAYRSLARKEHPDKAGTDNKGRFQEIQQAYAAVLRQRRNSNPSLNLKEEELATSKLPPESRQRREEQSAEALVGQIAMEAVEHAETCRDAADRAVSSAYQSFQLASKGASVRNMSKRNTLRELRDIAAQGIAQLRGCAVYLRSVRDAAVGVSRCAKASLDKYGEWADLAIAGAGLRDRADIVADAAKAVVCAAEHLDKVGEASELTLRQVARSQQDTLCGMSDGSLSRQSARVLSENLTRNASVARCAADEAINSATKALELSCSLVALDREWRREKERSAEKRSASDESPVHGKDGPIGTPDRQDGSPTSQTASAEEAAEAKDKPADEQHKDQVEESAPAPEKSALNANGKGKSEMERVKQQHINLRVKNLQCLGSLNEEVLGLQAQLRKLFQRGEGGLLPVVSLTQKDGVFDLVQQLLHAALAEAGKLICDPALPAQKVLERAFAFALALEHTKEVALSAEVKTHVFKLAALVDIDLLCQIIDGPFRSRLLAVGARPRGGSMQSHSPSPFNANAGGNMRNSLKGSRVPRAAPDAGSAWAEAAGAFCSRLLRSLRAPVSDIDKSAHRNAATA